MIRKEGSSEPTSSDVVGSFSEASSGTETILDAVPVDDGVLDLVSMRQLTSKKVWEGCLSDDAAEPARKLGRVSAFLFHPSENRCIGFLVKLPDMALMFCRKDLFVSFGGFDISQGRIVAGDAAGNKGKTAEKAARAAGVSLDECVIWQGLPAVCEDGTVIGAVSDVLCELGTGDVYEMEVGNGAAANALLGTLRVPVDEIVGFRICHGKAVGTEVGNGYTAGIGSAASSADSASVGSSFPAIMVRDSVKMRSVEGGVAEKAGGATAVVAHNAKQAIGKIAPKAKEAGAAAGEAVNKGAYVTGRQIGRTKGMFTAFKEEFDKALHDDDARGA